MENPTTNEIIKRLEADWPNWEVWTVHQVVGGTTWCARRRHNPGIVLNADSPDELAEQLEEAATR
jgi:hypothetical protein